MKVLSKIPKQALAIPYLIVGVLILVVAVASRRGPQQKPPGEEARTVRVIAAPEVDLVPRAFGFGTVAPATVWQAIAQVTGRAIEVNPRLEEGAIITSQTLLARIDPTDYQLALS